MLFDQVLESKWNYKKIICNLHHLRNIRKSLTYSKWNWCHELTVKMTANYNNEIAKTIQSRGGPMTLRTSSHRLFLMYLTFVQLFISICIAGQKSTGRYCDKS